MRTRTVLAIALFCVPSLVNAQTGDGDARAVAQRILDQGAALFDTRDASAMAETYLPDAQIVLVQKASDSDATELEITRGRDAIRKGYADLFRDRKPEHRARNTVEFAKFLSPTLLLIQGRFALDRDQGDVIQFVQVRSREGDAWKIVTLHLTPLPGQ